MDESRRPLPSSDQAPLELLFIHHSIGAHLLADEGPESADGRQHPCGGGLRRRLAELNCRVNEASYGSALGQRTDLFDWLPKFRDHMDAILRIEQGDRALPDGRQNDVVMFKSCFPNNQFVGPGSEPGDARGPALTEANAQATLRALLPLFAARPRTLFVFLTTPPLAPVPWPESPLKRTAKRLLGRPTSAEKFAAAGQSAARFAHWAASPDGWLAGVGARNVAVFDYYAILSEGSAPFLRYPSGPRGEDSHPSAFGQRKAAAAFVPFLLRALDALRGAPDARVHTA